MYNYFNAVRQDVEKYVEENKSYYQYYFDNEDWYGLEEKLNEDLWTEDSVTGNGSGSYTFNIYMMQKRIYATTGRISKLHIESSEVLRTMKIQKRLMFPLDVII